MNEVVIFATGSPIVVDYEASLQRCGIGLAAAIKNHPGDDHLLDRSKLVDLERSATYARLPFVVPLFTPGHRQAATRQAVTHGFHTGYILVDASVPPLHAVECGQGVFVNCGSTIGAACQVGEFVLVNRAATIGHHCQIGPFVSVGPGAVLAGQVTIGAGAVIGAGATVLPKTRIGANAVVAAGAVVTKDVPAHSMVAGNPARVKKSAIAGFANLSVD